MQLVSYESFELEDLNQILNDNNWINQQYMVGANQPTIVPVNTWKKAIIIPRLLSGNNSVKINLNIEYEVPSKLGLLAFGEINLLVDGSVKVVEFNSLLPFKLKMVLTTDRSVANVVIKQLKPTDNVPNLIELNKDNTKQVKNIIHELPIISYSHSLLFNSKLTVDNDYDNSSYYLFNNLSNYTVWIEFVDSIENPTLLMKPSIIIPKHSLYETTIPYTGKILAYIPDSSVNNDITVLFDDSELVVTQIQESIK